MSVLVHVLAIALFFFPPFLLFVLTIYLAPRLGKNREPLVFLSVVAAVAAIAGLMYLFRAFFGFLDVRIQASISGLCLALVVINYNRKFPGKHL
jgi:hypothetical protein